MSDLEEVIEESIRQQHDLFLKEEDKCPRCGGPMCWMPIEGELKAVCACELLEGS